MPFDLVGQGWIQLGELALSFVLAAAVGVEREIRQKSAGLRTYSLVGVSAALFMLVSKYGFMNVLENGRVMVDPSRVAAQIVSGIGFIGGGVIFMRRDVVRGLTTAASVWLTAAVGMACGAGLPILAVATTIGYFLIMFVYPRLVRRFLPRGDRTATGLRIVHRDRPGLARTIAAACAELRFTVEQMDVERASADVESGEQVQDAADTEGNPVDGVGTGTTVLTLHVSGAKAMSDLVVRLSEIDGVIRVGSTVAPLD